MSRRRREERRLRNQEPEERTEVTDQDLLDIIASYDNRGRPEVGALIRAAVHDDDVSEDEQGQIAAKLTEAHEAGLDLYPILLGEDPDLTEEQIEAGGTGGAATDIDPDNMGRDDLVEYGNQHLGLDLPANSSKADALSAVKTALGQE